MILYISYKLSFVSFRCLPDAFFFYLSVELQTLLTICEGHDGTETSNGDVLIFPDMIRYRYYSVDIVVDDSY